MHYKTNVKNPYFCCSDWACCSNLRDNYVRELTCFMNLTNYYVTIPMLSIFIKKKLFQDYIHVG